MTEFSKYRLLEMIPGVLIWGTFLFSIILSFIKPLWVIYFIIVFCIYWLIKIFYLAPYMIYTYYKYKKIAQTDWLQEIKKSPKFNNIYHLLVIPTYGEPLEILTATFKGIAEANFPGKKMIVVLGGEEKEGEKFLAKAKVIEEKFGQLFFHFMATVHPQDIPGELAGKGANGRWMGKKAKEFIDQQNIPYENIIVSNFDSDTVAHPEYYSYLTYKYLTSQNPTHQSYQPVPLFNNNIWESPFFIRVASYGTTFWMMSEQVRPERLFTFSSHSMSFKALVDVDFWQADIVSEDSRIFVQCFLEYDGDYKTVPLYLPVSMDAVSGENWWQAAKAVYKQQRRWAYGAESIPFMLYNFYRSKIPFWKKFKHIFNQIEGTWSWATAPILITILGRLPLWVAGDEIQSTIIYQNAPYVLQWLLSLGMVGLILSAILSATLLPKRPQKEAKHKYLVMILQWIFLPVTMVVFGSFPATDAQTRLMFGKYLGFNVTKKIRKQQV